MQQGKPGTPLAYEVFDVLEVDGEPVVDLPLTERRARLEELLAPNPVVQLSGVFEDGEALLEAASEQGLEGVMAKRAVVALPEGQARPRLAEDQDARPAGVRDLRLDEGPGPAQRQLRRARARRPARRASGSGSGMWVRASASATIDELLEKLEPFAARRVAVSRSSRRCRRCGKATSSGSSPSSSPRSSSPSGRTTATCALRPSRGSATTSRRADVRRERPGRGDGGKGASSPTSTRSSGRTRGSRRAT